ncbi:glycosyl hydrolase [Paenibacillus oryzisoli]|uniref:glycosyl hydrolase n=1 Tax=Paenibacillus oryzisoli TaxID=1850517 RepID=UPI003D2DB24E
MLEREKRNKLDAAVFEQPPAAYRSAPFWSWNDKLEPEELRRQIREMKRAGLGGFFMHARQGLSTPYMGEEFLRAVEVSVEEAQAQGMEAWCYDENGWPSGTADGVVPALGPEYQQKWLEGVPVAKEGLDEALRELGGDPDFLFGLVRRGARWEVWRESGVETETENPNGDRGQAQRQAQAENQRNARHLAEAPDRGQGESCTDPNSHAQAAQVWAKGYPEAAPGVGTVFALGDSAGDDAAHVDEALAVYCRVNPYYVDILSADVMQAFLNACHEVYRARLGDRFGPDGIPGIFTDEFKFSGLPWSADLAKAYADAYGEPIVQAVGWLLAEAVPADADAVLAMHQARYRYWRLVSERFRRSMRKVADWCDEHGWQLTGHVMGEDSLLDQMRYTAGVMPLYERMHMPGIDLLGSSARSVLLPKQASSVARQLGKPFVLTETFGCCGWNLSFREMKRIAEWQFVLGVNRMSQHLQAYAIRGVRKRDYPPSLYIQQPWWDVYRTFNDYFARLTYVLTLGHAVPGVLVLHPMRTAWLQYGPGGTQAVARLQDSLDAVAEELLALQRDFDYGDEALLAQHGAVTGGALRVGEMTYGTVILPDGALTLDAPTLELLRQFAAAGGQVLLLGAAPPYVEGAPSPEAAAWFGSAAVTRVAAAADLRAHVRARGDWQPAGAEGAQAGDAAQAEALRRLYVQERRVPGATLLYAVHTGEAGTVRLRIPAEDRRLWRELDLAQGHIGESDVRQASPLLVFEPGDAKCFAIWDAGADTEGTSAAGKGAPTSAASDPSAQRAALVSVPTGVSTEPPPQCAAPISATSAPSAQCLARVPVPTGVSTEPSEPLLHPMASIPASADRLSQPAPQTIPLDTEPDWRYELSAPNVLTLDYAAYRIDYGEWTAPTYVLNIQERCIVLGRPVHVELAYSFETDEALIAHTDRSTWKLAVELPADWQLAVNGSVLSGDAADGWFGGDRSFPTYPIGEAVQTGRNEVRLSGIFFANEDVYRFFGIAGANLAPIRNKLLFDVEIESLYILGPFAVQPAALAWESAERHALWTEGPFTLTPLPKQLPMCDMTPHGFPFYSGTVALERIVPLAPEMLARLQEGTGRLVLQWDRMLTPALRITVNRGEAHTVLWGAPELDLTTAVCGSETPSELSLYIELITSGRNTFGPHHHVKGEVTFVGPTSFTDKVGWVDAGADHIWTDRYCVISCGLLGLRLAIY